MSDLIKMYKPNGQEIEVHKDSFTHAVNLGWSKTNPNKKPAAKKKPAKKEG